MGTPGNLSVTLVNGAGHVTWQVPSSVRSVSHYKVEYGVEGDASYVHEVVGGNTHKYTSAILGETSRCFSVCSLKNRSC